MLIHLMPSLVRWMEDVTSIYLPALGKANLASPMQGTDHPASHIVWPKGEGLLVTIVVRRVSFLCHQSPCHHTWSQLGELLPACHFRSHCSGCHQKAPPPLPLTRLSPLPLPLLVAESAALPSRRSWCAAHLSHSNPFTFVQSFKGWHLHRVVGRPELAKNRCLIDWYIDEIPW